MFNNIKSLPHISDLQTKASDQHLKHKEIVEFKNYETFLLLKFFIGHCKAAN